MFFTQLDYEKIEEYLKLKAKKDTDFALINDEGNPVKINEETDTMVIVHRDSTDDLGRNVQIKLTDFIETAFFLKNLEELMDKQAAYLLKIDLAIYKMERIMGSLLASKTGVSTLFGDSPTTAISQDTLTLAINAIWNKISEISGERFLGITFKVYPNYYIEKSPEDNTLQVDITIYNCCGVFEKVDLYMNDSTESFFHYEKDTPVSSILVPPVTINSECDITCKATVLGITYTEVRHIYHYLPFWIFAGDYSEEEGVKNYNISTPLSNSSLVTLKHGKCSKDVVVNEGQYLYVVLGKDYESMFIRADMNGVEIPFVRDVVTIDGRECIIYKSLNPYSEGTYNIDINS